MTWEQRKQNILNQLTMRQVIDHYGIEANDSGEEAQISCPFHGKDSKKSGHIYEDTQLFHCFTCKKTVDVIGFIVAMENIEWKNSLWFIEKKFNIDTSKLKDIKITEPFEPIKKPKPITTKQEAIIPEDFDRIHKQLEKKVVGNRSKFELASYCKTLYVLDMCAYEKNNQINDPYKMLRTLKTKINEKLRSI